MDKQKTTQDGKGTLQTIVIKELGHIILAKKDPTPNEKEEEEVKRIYEKQNEVLCLFMFSLDDVWNEN